MLASQASRISRSDFSQNLEGHSRQALEEKVRSHEWAIIELKSTINRMSPTACLPPEILSEIFVLIATDHYEWRKENHYGSAHAYKWIALTHVCRHWRDVALNTPRLWSRVVLTRPEVFREILPRSKKASLWVSASLPHADERRLYALEALMKESSRLRELNLTAPARFVQVISSQWKHPADNLESIILHAEAGQFEPDYLIPSTRLSSEFFSGQTPKLRHLEIHRIPADWTSPLFCPSLRTLRIHLRYDLNPQPGEFPKLLQALEAMPMLETLQLNEAIPRLPDDITQLPDLGRRVSLPHLRKIDMFSDAIECANLLRHLSLPQGVRVIANGRTERGAEDLVRIFGEYLSHSPPPLTAQLAPMYSSQVYVKLWRSDVHCNDYISFPGPIADAEISLDAFPHCHALEALVLHSTFFSKIQRFEIHSFLKTWNWKALFERMPELRTLFVSAQPENSFLPALSAVRNGDGDEPGTLPLPHLHTVELNGARFGCSHSNHESRFLEELLSWLILRCNYGVPVSKLVLRDCINADEDEVERLREVVPEVDWDGNENFEDDVDETGSDVGDMMRLDEIFFDPLGADDLYDDEDDDLDFFMIPFGF
ncbi:hypothetical protein C8Q77DRAFT_1133456 [Trametes polyzona]|nr:hypothetical protein C8Q77DRAFT_1133456 [Trametes polyzona]